MLYMTVWVANIDGVYRTSKIKNLEENVGAVNVDITPAEVAKVRKLVDEAEIVGTRYPTALMGGLMTDTPEL